jgi:hypothetical protein
MTTRRLRVVDHFAPEARALRATFDARFAEPRRAHPDRFAWDYWHVPGQYTALRTPAHLYFAPRVYRAFHARLVAWGRKNLGCHDVSPPWLSAYVEGCRQELHGDLPHGPFAFVFSLTRWARRRFTGGETLIVRDEVLDYWSDFRSVRGVEEAEVLEAVPPEWNRLVVFDPRIPHGVRRVEGTHDPREARLVIHGWFVDPKPVVEGPLRDVELERAVVEIGAAMAPVLDEGLPVAGLLSLGLTISPAGRVSRLALLADTTRVSAPLEPERLRLLGLALGAAKGVRFSKRARATRVTLPFTFARG